MTEAATVTEAGDYRTLDGRVADDSGNCRLEAKSNVSRSSTGAVVVLPTVVLRLTFSTGQCESFASD
jgi:hypothetical protein